MTGAAALRLASQLDLISAMLKCHAYGATDDAPQLYMSVIASLQEIVDAMPKENTP